jgi:sugar/nucleoside kinase (ribokinase family)
MINFTDNSPVLPICAGQLGWDITKIGEKKNISFGGAVLHFLAAASTVGVYFKCVGYANHAQWKKIITGLELQGVDTTSLIDFKPDIEFYMAYDKELNFKVDEFKMFVSKQEPDIPNVLSQIIKEGQLVHLCPTTLEQDRRSIEVVLNTRGKLSFQLHINNLLSDVNYYRNAVKYADYIFLNKEETLVLTNETHLKAAIKQLPHLSNGTFYITSSCGVVASCKDDVIHCPSLRVSLVDPTGAGDAFAGGCTAGRILTGSNRGAIRLGVLCASTKLTGFSSNSLLSLLNIDFESDLSTSNLD